MTGTPTRHVKSTTVYGYSDLVQRQVNIAGVLVNRVTGHMIWIHSLSFFLVDFEFRNDF